MLTMLLFCYLLIVTLVCLMPLCVWCWLLFCLLLLTCNNKKVREESVRERQLFPTIGRDKTAAL